MQAGLVPIFALYCILNNKHKSLVHNRPSRITVKWMEECMNDLGHFQSLLLLPHLELFPTFHLPSPSICIFSVLITHGSSYHELN